VIHNCPRIFSAKAQEHSTLLKLTTEQFKRLVDDYPEFYAQILRQSVKRHMKIKISMEETKKFELVLRNEAFWFYKLNNEPLKIEIYNLLNKLQTTKDTSKSTKKIEVLTRRPSIRLNHSPKKIRQSISVASSQKSFEFKFDRPKFRVLIDEVVKYHQAKAISPFQILKKNNFKSSQRTLKKRQENLILPVIIESLEAKISDLNETVSSLELQFVKLAYLAEELNSKNKKMSDRLSLLSEEMFKIMNTPREQQSVESIISQIKQLLEASSTQKSESELSEEMSIQAPKEEKENFKIPLHKVVVDNRTGLRYPSLVLGLPINSMDISEVNPLKRSDSMDDVNRVPAIQTQINVPNLAKIGSKIVDIDHLYLNNFEARSKKRFNSSNDSSKHIQIGGESSWRKIDRKKAPMLGSNKQVTLAYNPKPRKKSSIETMQDKTALLSCKNDIERSLIHQDQLAKNASKADGKHNLIHRAKFQTKLGYEYLLAQDLDSPNILIREEDKNLRTASASGQNNKQPLMPAAQTDDFSEDKSVSGKGQEEPQPEEQKKSFFFKSKRTSRTNSSVLHKRNLPTKKSENIQPTRKSKLAQRPQFKKLRPFTKKRSSEYEEGCLEPSADQQLLQSTEEFGFEHSAPIDEI
jgi:hypothetical protein